MAEYQATATDTKVFQLLSEETVVGMLQYTEWYTFKAAAALADGSSFQITPKGFWGTTIELKDQDKVLLSFKMNWDGSIIIKSRLTADGRAFVVKSKGTFKQSFVLLDKDGQELVVVKPGYKWNKISPEYQISTTDSFEELAAKHLLLLTTVHCINYYMTMAVSTILMAS
ncbi:hypothetical protein [Hymenobacter lucidus]|uniref:Lipocalin/cytosolic fatty-acid binding domain-containing protein n=1 Tax=Hymenobacter lucidus TaxID=2880930 RepID=A0ABS8AU58_9BACT|nr:hypothetical protein [Hymenobacter lucidus]MCB2409098.1 hypothetical protein [Hymenobacter lucidus]